MREQSGVPEAGGGSASARPTDADAAARPTDAGGPGRVSDPITGAGDGAYARDIVPVLVPGRGESSYEVRIGSGLLEGIGSWLGRVCPAHRYVVVSDDTVAGLHAERVGIAMLDAGMRFDLLTFPAGEPHKTRDTWSTITDRMLEAGVGRDAAVIAFGGGVTGDLAGFVAATYMRGIPCVQVPTTLLAMIDSSVGGKTGVDAPAGKNLVGAFHPPHGVLADLSVLASLPDRELRAGLAEALKHGAIADARHFEWIASNASHFVHRDPEALAALVHRSVSIKAEVVAADELEAGPRKMLNFGHTLGHAIEAESGYDLLHGEAIAIGMVLEARLGEALGTTRPGTAETMRAAVEALGLLGSVPADLSPAAIVARTRADKKARAGAVEYTLIESIGRAASAGGRWTTPVDERLVHETMQADRATDVTGFQDDQD